MKKEKRKEKIQFLTPHGSGCTLQFSKVFTRTLVEILMVRVRKLESLPINIKIFCDVLRLCSVWVILI